MSWITKILYTTIALALINTASAFSAFSDSLSPEYDTNATIQIDLTNLQCIRPTIALVLSGGGARGFAQIGVLQEFEKANIKIDYITGTSIGSILGGLYASGYSANELDSIVMSTKWDDVFTMGNGADRNEYFLDQKLLNDRSILSFRFNNFKFVIPEAMSMGTKYTYFLQNLLWNATYQPFNSFDDLKYKFRAVATDVLSGESISFSSGSLVTAVKASSALPLRYTPVRTDNKILVDGGILANLPTEQAVEFSPDMIIAVRSSSPLYVAEDLDKPWNLADQVISVAMKKFEKKAESLADFVLVPQINFHKNSDFTHIDSLIEKGKAEARRNINAIKQRIDNYRDSVINDRLSNIINLIKSNPRYLFSSEGLAYEDSIRLQSLNLQYSSYALLKSIMEFKPYKHLELVYRLIKDTNALNNNLLDIRIIANKFDRISALQLCSDYQDITSPIQDSINLNFIKMWQSPAAINSIKEQVLNELRANGINLCSIDSSQISFAGDTIVMNITIPKIRNIIINGNSTISNNLIFRDIIVHNGDFINADKLCKSWENVFSTGWFSSVDLKLQMNETLNMADVYITVKEIGTQVINLGLRLDEARKTRIGLDIIQENLFNFGTRVYARFYGGERDLSANLVAEQPRFVDTYLTFKAHAYYTYKRLFSYKYSENLSNNDFSYHSGNDISTQAYGLRFSAGRQLEKKGRIGLEARFEKQRYYDTDINHENKPDFYSVNTLKFETIFDSEDKIDFATKGRVIGLSLETNLFSTSGSQGFSKAILEYKANHTTGRHTWSPGFYFGFADISTPLPELFDLGGQDDFFGIMEEQEMGRQLARGQFEYRYKAPFTIFFDTYFSLRYDIGAVWAMPEAIKLSELKHGIGATIAFDTPVGPAKFSIGRSFFFTKSPAQIIYGPVTLYYSIGLKL